MVDYYRINVAKDGRYLFATEQAGITNDDAAQKMYKLFKEKFPQSEGYDVTVRKWEGRGHKPSWAEEE